MKTCSLGMLLASLAFAALDHSASAAAETGWATTEARATAAADPAPAQPKATGSKQKEADVPVPDEMPRPVKTVPPAYPESARQRNQEGTVFVQVSVLKSGKVGRAKLVEGKGVAADLDKAALDAVRQWEFTPAKIKGKPVAAWVVIPVAFRLK